MSTKPPDYEYGNLKLKYIPPPPDLEEGQVYLRKREFVEKTSGRLSEYMKENPFVPLSLCSTLGFLAVGFTFSMQKKHNLATRMMYGLVGSQAVFVVALNNATKKTQAKRERESLLALGNTEDIVQDLSDK